MKKTRSKKSRDTVPLRKGRKWWDDGRVWEGKEVERRWQGRRERRKGRENAGKESGR